MRKTNRLVVGPIALTLAAVLFVHCDSFAQAHADAPQIQTSTLDQQIRDFLQREVTAHVADIKTLEPPPDRVLGALTTGEFSWGTFMRTLGAYSEFAGTKTIANHSAPQMIGEMAHIELDHGGKTWAQLYAAMALESFGTDLNHNVLWQGLSSEERTTYIALLDPGRFYDAKTHTLIHLPENYFGVAARIAAIDYELGLNKNRASLDDLLNQAAKQFTGGALFADDALPTGRYDRYSNEYARALYDAAELAGRDDLIKAVAPSLMEQMKLWTHLLSIFAFGRGDYSYITKEREWQQTTTFFGKVIAAHRTFMKALEKEEVKSFPRQLSLADVARVEYFRDGPGRKFGVWVVRQGNLHFALPFVTGQKAATSDYEPAPHGFPGFAVPVEKIYPCLVPFLELEDGRTIAPADGADEIRPALDGKSVTAFWKRWVLAGSKAGETVDSALVSEVTWSLQGNSLHRVESLIASKPLKIRRLWLAIPSRDSHFETVELGNARIERFTSNGETLDVQVKHSDWPVQISAYATGDNSLGRGDRGAIPLHLILESRNISLTPGAPESWEITLSTQ